MNILLTNDDGVFAPGLRALVEAFTAAGHSVFVCAPDCERSAASHAVTLQRPLCARPVDMPGAEAAWAVDGTPADCAGLGMYLMGPDSVDIVISGINRGMNQGGAAIYSGTVAAALEASMRGAQAMAVSLCVPPRGGVDDSDYWPAARVALRVAEWLWAHPLSRGDILNLNVPALPWAQIRGVAVATMAPIFLEAPRFEPCPGGDGACYRHAGGASLPMDDPEYDMVKTSQGYASLTRLTWDMRAHAPMDAAGIELYNGEEAL